MYEMLCKRIRITFVYHFLERKSDSKGQWSMRQRPLKVGGCYILNFVISTPLFGIQTVIH